MDMPWIEMFFPSVCMFVENPFRSMQTRKPPSGKNHESDTDSNFDASVSID